MLFLEEYEIDPANINEIMEMLEDSKEVLQTIKEPFFKDWKVYQSTEDPGKLKTIVLFGESGNLNRLLEIYLKHPKANSVIERFQSLIIGGSLKQVHYKELISL
jgi:hypothetical protein